MAGARKKRSGRGGQRPASPPPALENELLRRQLARDERDDLLESLDWLLGYYPKVAQRRGADRQAAMEGVGGALLGWAALIAERGEDRLPERLFAASCLLTSPCDAWWAGLVVSGLQGEVRSQVERRGKLAMELDSKETDHARLERARTQAPLLVERVREVIGDRTVAAADVVPVAGEMLLAAVAEPAAQDLTWEASGRSLAALWLLEADLPAADEVVRTAVSEELAEFRAAFPSMLDHARSHVEDPAVHPAPSRPWAHDDVDGVEQDDELSDDEDDSEEHLADGLAIIDHQLSVTDDPGAAVELAEMAAGLMVTTAGAWLSSWDAHMDAACRLLAAHLALRPGDEWDAASVDVFPDEARELMRAHLVRAAEWLEADISPSVPTAADPSELLERLDELIQTVKDEAESEDASEDSLTSSLGLAVVAAEVLRVGLQLNAGRPDHRDAIARGLGVLDPVALAAYPERRVRAGAELRELAARKGLVVTG